MSPPKSQSIPISNSGGMQRTASEVQLYEEEEMADFRDYVMFTRIVNGIVRTQEETKDYKLKQENDTCLAHVIGARNDSCLLKENERHLDAARGDSEALRSYQQMPRTSSGGPDYLRMLINSTLQTEAPEQDELILEDDGMFAMDM